jgi:energy-coupling factor transporter ATP-binding protein EcfA2
VSDASAAVDIDRLSVTYPFRSTPALREVTLTIAKGERVLLLGPSGCGKSTLGLCLNGLVPKSMPARLTGDVSVLGRRVRQHGVADFADCIAYVFQDVDSQFCALTIEDEIAFALENRLVPPAQIDRRIDAALAQVGMPAAFRTRRTQTLSGGEKQKVLLAAALAQDAAIYVFDEATSQLDPASTAETFATIGELAAAEPRSTLILIEHKLEQLLPLIDRVFLFDDGGAVRAEAPPAEMFYDKFAAVTATGAWCPPAATLFSALRREGISVDGRPLTTAAAGAMLDRLVTRNPRVRPAIKRVLDGWCRERIRTSDEGRGRPVLRLDRVAYAPRGGPRIVSDITLTLHGGEIVGLVGQNGAGKSTLGMLIAGLLRPTMGRRETLDGGESPPRLVFQNPEHQFVGSTVRDELLASLRPSRNRPGASPDAVAQRVESVLRAANLWPHRDAHPYELSQGQKRTLSVVATTLAGPSPILVLDEPSYGLDALSTARLQARISGERRTDRVIVLISHDLDLVAALCDRVVVLARGRVARSGSAAEVLSDAPFLTAMRLAMPAAYRFRSALGALAA